MEETQAPQVPAQNPQMSGKSIGAFSLPGSTMSLIIGAVVLILIPALAAFLFIRSRNTAPSPTKKVESVSTKAGSGFSELVPATNTPQKPDVNQKTKNYTDTVLGYSIQIPNDWETFKQKAVSDTSYQTGVRPVGSADIPVTISGQPNPMNVALSDIIDTQYGKNYPRQKTQVAGVDAISVKSDAQSYVAYYINKNGKLYQLSASTTPVYQQVFSQILASFQFTR
ncbi:MAG TPA: hypothetical protein VLF68_02345 [Candidatus Saccharimonadales bacterium]|nr:hypothetical protein [Candidatus Saccharimonadales bacterium]